MAHGHSRNYTTLTDATRFSFGNDREYIVPKSVTAILFPFSHWIIIALIIRSKKSPFYLSAIMLSELEATELITHSLPAIFRDNQTRYYEIGLPPVVRLRGRTALINKK